MPRTGFYNDNANRNYPFTPDSTLLLAGNVPLPSSIIVDFGCILGQSSQFSFSDHQVTLSSISRVGTQYTLVFGCDAPGLITRPLFFTRDSADSEYTTQFVDSLAFSNIDDAACDIDFPAWEGFLVTGDLTELDNIITDGTTASVTAGGFVLEPARIQDISSTFIQTVNLANEQRLRVIPTPDCTGVGTAGNDASIPAPGLTVVNASCLSGALLLQEGYNCFIIQNSTRNSISINAVAGAGSGDPCNDEVERYDGELVPANSSLYTGGPSCFDLLRSLNGIKGPELRLTAGDGVSVTTPSDQPNTIVVNINLRNLTVCEPPITTIGDPDNPSSSGNPGGIPSGEVVPSPVVTFCAAVWPDQCVELNLGGIDSVSVVPAPVIDLAGVPAIRPAPIAPPDPQVGTPQVVLSGLRVAPLGIDSVSVVPEPAVGVAQYIEFPGIDTPATPVPSPYIVTLILPTPIDPPADQIPGPVVSITGVDARRPMYYYRRQHNSANLLAQRVLTVVQFGPFINPAVSAAPLTSLSLTIEVSKDGGETFVARSSTITPTHESQGWYQVFLDKCDTSEVGPLVVRASGVNGAFIPVWREFMVVSSDYFIAKLESGTCSN